MISEAKGTSATALIRGIDGAIHRQRFFEVSQKDIKCNDTSDIALAGDEKRL